MNETAAVLCACGCGTPTSLITKNCVSRGTVAGEYRKFIHNHHITGNRNPRWNESRKTIDRNGYSVVILRGHPLGAKGTGFVREHELIVYEAIGRKLLPPKAEIHHFDENKLNNRNDNLVVCENTTYHKLLHYRQRALRECGNPDWMRCKVCKQWDEPSNLYVRKNSTHARSVWHRSCINEYNKQAAARRLAHRRQSA